MTMIDAQSADQLFITRLTQIVLANISREDFDVEELAREVHLSRSSIHRRLKRLTNQNASQFIREIRLKKAMEMLVNGLGTASEIAYRVGFGSPAYFTRCFHEYYGYPPGEVKNRISVENDISRDALEPDTEIPVMLNVDKPGAISGRQRIRRSLLLTGLLIIPIIAIIMTWLSSDGFPRTSKGQSIVVLPFKNLSSDPDNQYIADGIMEDILNNLVHISNLRVISRTTSEHFRDTELTSKDIAQQVNARNILEGSMRRDGDRIMVSVQLIDASRDQHLWSQNYDRNISDMIGVQGEIAMQIADRLNTMISESEVHQLQDSPTKSPEAYDNYLRARFLLQRANGDQRFDISSEGLMASLQYYEKAIAADTNFAEAYAGLANAWFNLSAWGWYKPYFEGIHRAEYYCDRALERDPDCAEAHAVRGVYLAYPYRQFDESLKELQTSIQLDPNFSTARQWYAQMLMITGPIEEARIQVDRAVELEPYFWVVQNLNSWICYFEEKYIEGLEACTLARELNPNSPDNVWLFILHYARLGEAEKAACELENIFRRSPATSHYADEVEEACRNSGVPGIFRWLIDVNMSKPLPLEGLDGNLFYISWWYAILGDREKSIYWLEKTLEQKYIPMHYFNLITTNPDFDILRDDPRFTTILEETGLAAYNKRVL